MRIAYLVNRYPAVSHSFIRREIAAVEAAGHEITRISIRPPERDLPDAADQAEIARTTVILNAAPLRLIGAALTVAGGHPRRVLSALGLAFAMAGMEPRKILRHLAYLVEACFLLRLFDRQPVDHLHAHFGTNPAAVARLLRRLGGPRYSFTVHGPEEFDAPVALGLAGKIADAALVVGVSSFGASQLMRWCPPAAWSKIAVVRCGVDERFLDGGTDAATPSPGELVCVARLGAQKGLPLLIEAAGRLAAQGIAFRLTIVGEGELRPQIEAMIAERGLVDRVILAGSRDGAGVRDAILAGRALVLPSFAEGLPVVLMEALALGRPVIATAIAGIPELVDAECGWLIPAGSIDALADAMLEALTLSPQRLAAMGQIGRDRVLARHAACRNGAELARRIAALG